MILSKHEQNFLDALDGMDGPMPVEWLKAKYRTLIPRMRQLGLIYRRDPQWVQLTRMGRSRVGNSLPSPSALSGDGK